MKSNERKANADRILYEFGLYNKLKEVGQVHLIGSYRMDMMTWNDSGMQSLTATMLLIIQAGFRKMLLFR